MSSLPYAPARWWSTTQTEARSERILLAEGVCVLGDSLVLVRHRKMGWTIPGGHVEEGESPEDALRREVREETGLRVLKVCGEIVDVHGKYEAHVFVCRVEGTIRPQDPDILDVSVLPLREALGRIPAWQAEIVTRALKKFAHHECSVPR